MTQRLTSTKPVSLPALWNAPHPDSSRVVLRHRPLWAWRRIFSLYPRPSPLPL